jgi:ketosteroid isomerase-like protein
MRTRLALRSPLAWLALLALPSLAGASTPRSAPDALPTPQAAVEELLATDRAFAAASARTDVVAGLAPMLSEEIVMPAPPGRLVRGKAAVLDALRENPDNTAGRVEWAPVRGGVSADGLHGFTFGFMTLHRADGTTLPLKYLSYWIREDGEWRVAAYKRGRRPEGAVSTDLLPAALPARLVPPSRDAAALAAHRESLAAAEQAFSDEAQRIGLGPAFARWGSADAMNLGGPDSPGFVLGAEAIGRTIGAGDPGPSSSVHWSAEEVRVASSGDLGVSIGWIRLHEKGEDGAERPPIPFFTVWRRAGPGEPWRYVAE